MAWTKKTGFIFSMSYALALGVLEAVFDVSKSLSVPTVVIVAFVFGMVISMIIRSAQARKLN